MVKSCACGKQIVWFFDNGGTIIACKDCEKTFHFSEKKCDECGETLTHFKEVE